MNYSIGDKVTIKHDLVANYELDIVPDMTNYEGQTATIVSICKNDEMGICYSLDVDDEFWNWSENCFE